MSEFFTIRIVLLSRCLNVFYNLKRVVSRIFGHASFRFDGIYFVIGMLVNPFFLIRRNLYKNICEMSHNVNGRVLDFGCGSKP